MDAVAVAVGACWTFAGLLCLGLALPLARGMVGRNPVYGVRFPESFRSDEAWAAINRYGGRRMALWSLPTIAVGLVCLVLPLQAHPRAAVALAVAPIAFVLAPAFEAWRFARRYEPDA